MAEFTPKALPYAERLEKVQRIIRAAQYRYDPKIALRELCEALAEMATALQEREQERQSRPAPGGQEAHP